MIRSLIIDDELQSREALEEKLKKYCPQVSVIATCKNAEEGLSAIRRHSPDLVFLDIEMPQMNGFTMLEQFQTVPADVIFTTAYDQYAIKAIRFSALDYLLKPIDVEELKQAVKRWEEKKPDNNGQQLQLLLQNLKSIRNSVNKIALPAQDGLHYVHVKDIMRLESESNYTTFHFVNEKKLVVSKTMKEYEEMLEEFNFLRVHHSHLINMMYVKKYVKGEGGYVIMEDDARVEVSARKKAALIEKLSKR